MSEFREAIRFFNRCLDLKMSKAEARRMVRQRYPHQVTFQEGVVQ